MHLGHMFDAIRGKRAAEGGDGKCRATTGAVLDLELYKFDRCPYCQVVFRAVDKLALPVRYRDIDQDDDAARKLVEVGGMDQVPCLFIDGKPLYESEDIVAFLEKNFAAA
jgi:glutaredoxin